MRENIIKRNLSEYCISKIAKDTNEYISYWYGACDVEFNQLVIHERSSFQVHRRKRNRNTRMGSNAYKKISICHFGVPFPSFAQIEVSSRHCRVNYSFFRKSRAGFFFTRRCSSGVFVRVPTMSLTSLTRD